MTLPLISSAARSPWVNATRDLTAACGDHEERLTPVAFDRPVTEEYLLLYNRVTIFDVPGVPLANRSPDAAKFLDAMLTRRVSKIAVDRGRYGPMCHHGRPR